MEGVDIFMNGCGDKVFNGFVKGGVDEDVIGGIVVFTASVPAFIGHFYVQVKGILFSVVGSELFFAPSYGGPTDLSALFIVKVMCKGV